MDFQMAMMTMTIPRGILANTMVVGILMVLLPGSLVPTLLLPIPTMSDHRSASDLQTPFPGLHTSARAFSSRTSSILTTFSEMAELQD